MQKPIRLTRVRQNNLKNVTVEIPPKKITVITGLSGSGKSSLAFDTLYAEGQRRYVESLSTYTRQFLEKMPKPDLDRIENIPPAIALEQKNHVVNSRSTVGTQTEIVDYLKLLYAKTGKTICPDCNLEVQVVDSQSLLHWALSWLPEKRAYIVAPVNLNPPVKPPLRAKLKTSKKPPLQKQVDLATSAAQSTLALFREQGFGRVLVESQLKKKQGPLQSSQKNLTVFEIEDAALDSLVLNALFGAAAPSLTPARLYLVIDRLKVTESALMADPTSIRSRVSESIDQALLIGNGEIGFYEEGLKTSHLKLFKRQFACSGCDREFKKPEPNLFSFNSPVGACSKCSGFGFTLELDEALVVPDPTKTIKNGAIDPFSKPSFAEWQTNLFRFLERKGVSIGKTYAQLTISEKNLIWKGDPDAPAKPKPIFTGIEKCFEELKRWKYKIHIRVFVRRYQKQSLCPNCHGARLTPDALCVKVGGQDIAASLNQPIEESIQWLKSIQWTKYEKSIAKEILSQIEKRLLFLDEVGVGYLTLSRLAKSLSGGEFQRINLATQLGNGLCGTLYVLDEPSIGLHSSDTTRLIRVLKRLRDQGNTVVVVEHDLEVMRAADWLIELGPLAGSKGGDLVAAGTAQQLGHIPTSLTGQYLSGNLKLERNRAERPPARKVLRITGAREHCLKNVTVDFPLDRFVVISGISGSGKSTLIHRTLYPALSKIFYQTKGGAGNYKDDGGDFDRLYGAEQISGVVLLDQSPIGKSSRSNPATYLKAWDEVRRIFANQALALRRGYTPQHFSFNVDGGRCPVCKGEGAITLDMHFMAEVTIPCEECEGRRFKKSVLDVTFRGKNISQLLHTTIDDAYEIFRDNYTLKKKLGTLRDVGLGYLQVGQSAPTLSGGESQRLKIAATLDDSQNDNLLYLFDEPTTGLHLEDIKRLLSVVQDLVDARNSVIMIEHHPDVIAQADWVIDLGPGGGKNGGEILAVGTPRELAKNPKSITGKILLDLGHFPDLRDPS